MYEGCLEIQDLSQGGGPVAFAAAAIRRTARASETPALGGGVIPRDGGIIFPVGARRFVPALALTLMAAACVEEGRAGPLRFETVEIPSTSGSISIPEPWRFVTVPTGSGRVAAFAAATSGEVVDEFLTPPFKIQGIGPDDVTDEDAFVEIWITYLPDASLGEQGRIPKTFDLETLSATGEMLGQPILTVQGKNRGPSSALIDVRAWIGASASGADRDAFQQAIESIEL
jgi:hypothetical protein